MYDPNAMAGKIMLPGTLVASIVGIYQRKYLATHDTLLSMVNAVDASVLATHHRPSSLIPGGLEIPIKLVMKLTDNKVNSAKLQKSRKFVDEN